MKAADVASREKNADPRSWVNLCAQAQDKSIDIDTRINMMIDPGTVRPAKRAGTHGGPEDAFLKVMANNEDVAATGQEEGESSTAPAVDDTPTALVQVSKPKQKKKKKQQKKIDL
jgi:hypothetical protein